MLSRTCMAVQTGSRSITDVIHRSIDLHPLCVKIIDTPEYQRLRGIRQLGTCSYVFPCAVHDRFQHSLGVAYLAGRWASQFRALQPQLNITDRDVLCVTIAGLIHDLGHGPFSHFWEHDFLGAARQNDEGGGHEALSCALFDCLLESNRIDVSPWLDPELDLPFIKDLVAGQPDDDRGTFENERYGNSGVLGSDKRFLFDIVANQANGLDVDKLVRQIVPFILFHFT